MTTHPDTFDVIAEAVEYAKTLAPTLVADPVSRIANAKDPLTEAKAQGYDLYCRATKLVKDQGLTDPDFEHYAIESVHDFARADVIDLIGNNVVVQKFLDGSWVHFCVRNPNARKAKRNG